MNKADETPKPTDATGRLDGLVMRSIRTAENYSPYEGELAIVTLRMDEARSVLKALMAMRALLTRDDFWGSVQKAGWILPAEIDDCREALEPPNGEAQARA